MCFNGCRDDPPTVTQWYRETFKVFPMERLSAVIKGNCDAFYRI